MCENILNGKTSNQALILWADRSSPNLGVRVLAEGAAALLSAALDAHVEFTFQDFAGSETGVSLQKAGILRDLGRRNGQIKSLLREHSLIWDTGAGDSFTDIYGIGRLLRMVRVQRLAQRLGIPIFMGPQTIGPFSHQFSRWLATRSLAGMAAIFSRDPYSYAYLGQLAPASQAFNATDVVFALPPATETVRRDVLINVSGLLWSKNAHIDAAYYRFCVRQLIQHLIHGGREVSLLVHVLDNPTADNDVPACRELAQEFGIELLIPDDLHSARSIIVGSNLLIGSRMHACLNALSLGVPAIAWAYSRKFEPLFRSLGWEAVFDLRDRSTDIVSKTAAVAAAPDTVALTRLIQQADARISNARHSLESVL